MKVYKLTNEKGQTHGDTQWGRGVTHAATGKGTDLCSNAVIHFYRDPLLAVLANPIHANFSRCRLWECEAEDIVAEDALKGGCKKLTTLKKIKAPRVNKNQRVRWAILCALEVYHEESFVKWANSWLDKTDRSKLAARAVWAAGAASWAAGAAAVAADRAASWAAGAAGREIDLVALAYKAIEEE